MNLTVRSLLSTVLSSTVILFLTGWQVPQGDRVLIFLKNTSNQPAASVAAGALLSLVEQKGIQADTTSNLAYIAEDSLKNYHALLLFQTSSDILDTWQQNDVERFVQAGGGLGIINAAGFSRYQWPWYHDLLTGGDKPAGTGNSVFWTKKHDGGRVFFAQAGSTPDQALTDQILDGIKTSVEGPALNYREAHTLRTPEENRFTFTILDSFMEEPIEMEVMADNRVMYIERRGQVKLYDPATKSTKIINKIPVHLTGNYEDGLLGMELDPDFETNHFVYLYYSPVGNESVQNLSRFVFTETPCI